MLQLQWPLHCLVFIILEKHLTSGEDQQLINLKRNKNYVSFVKKGGFSNIVSYLFFVITIFQEFIRKIHCKRLYQRLIYMI